MSTRFLPLVRGFTLIELIVVVAIVGMLSSIVLTSLAAARNKAQDAGVKQNLHTVALQASLYFANAGNYGTVFAAATCPSTSGTIFGDDATIKNAIAAAVTASGGATRCEVSANGSAYAVSVGLKASTNHWCVDSVGNRRSISNVTWTGSVCPP